jgi:hypothetical protein
MTTLIPAVGALPWLSETMRASSSEVIALGAPCWFVAAKLSPHGSSSGELAGLKGWREATIHSDPLTSFAERRGVNAGCHPTTIHR